VCCRSAAAVVLILVLVVAGVFVIVLLFVLVMRVRGIDRYPVSLIQSYPENQACTNDRGDLIYGHIPFDMPGAVEHWVTRNVAGTEGMPRVPRLKALRAMPVPQLSVAAAVFPVVMLRDPVERVVSFANFLNMDQAVFEKHPERLSCNQQTSMVNGVPGCGGGCGAAVAPG
jgi:hypothetical protein